YPPRVIDWRLPAWTSWDGATDSQTRGFDFGPGGVCTNRDQTGRSYSTADWPHRVQGRTDESQPRRTSSIRTELSTSGFRPRCGRPQSTPSFGGIIDLNDRGDRNKDHRRSFASYLT